MGRGAGVDVHHKFCVGVGGVGDDIGIKASEGEVGGGPWGG